MVKFNYSGGIHMKKEQLYEGKAKIIYATENPDQIIMHYKDDATAGNGAKKGTIDQKGIINNTITTMLYQKLAENGVPTALIEKMNERDQLCRKVEIFPLEVIVRNVIAGSMAARLGIEEGVQPKKTIFEICYKNDDYGDPLINDDHAIAIGLATRAELDVIYRYTAKINQLLQAWFLAQGIKLIDFKVEFGKTSDGEIVLADEITPDTCRLWDVETNEKLDKDRFRRDLDNIEEAYQQIMKRVGEM